MRLGMTGVEVAVNRRFISCVLLASFSLLNGCYSTGTITKEELKARVEQVDITIYTKDSLEYHFSEGNYRIQDDTLSGVGVEVSTDTSENDSVRASIPFSDITSVDVEDFDLTGTMIVYVLSVGAFVALLAGAAALSEI
jgi:hypothetical protein